jgi:hypothetical protein
LKETNESKEINESKETNESEESKVLLHTVR